MSDESGAILLIVNKTLLKFGFLVWLYGKTPFPVKPNSLDEQLTPQTKQSSCCRTRLGGDQAVLFSKLANCLRSREFTSRRQRRLPAGNPGFFTLLQRATMLGDDFHGAGLFGETTFARYRSRGLALVVSRSETGTRGVWGNARQFPSDRGEKARVWPA